MKYKIIRALLIFSCVGFLACKSEDLTTDNVGQVVNVFELKYGESIGIQVDNNNYIFALKNASNNVPCLGLVDFVDYQKQILEIRAHAYLQINGNDKLLDVQSAPGGTAFDYLDNGTDVSDIQRRIDELKSTGVALKDSTYFNRAFIKVFGSGAVIKNTSLKIFLAKTNITQCQQPNATVEQYKLILIVTKQS